MTRESGEGVFQINKSKLLSADIWISLDAPAVRTSGGFYRGNIESFSETGPSSSFMFQHDSVSFFGQTTRLLLLKLSVLFLFFLMYFSYRPTLGEEPPELVGTSFCDCSLWSSRFMKDAPVFFKKKAR